MIKEITRLDVMSWGGFVVFASSSVITPVCLPEISKTLSTSLSEGGGAEAFRTFLLFLVLLVSGILANQWGKKPLILSGHYLIAFGLLIGSFSESYITLILSLMIVGMGGGALEAILNPLVSDLHPKNTGQFLNFSNAFYPFGIMVSAILFGELLTLDISWRFIFRFASFTAFVMGLIFTFSRFPHSSNKNRSTWGPILTVLSNKKFWIFAIAMFLGGGVESAFTFWSRSFVEIFLNDLPRAGAMAIVIFSTGMVLGRLLSAKLTEVIGLNFLMLFSSFFGLVVTVFVPFTDSLEKFYSLLFAAGITTACFWPTILAVAKENLNADTTILMILLAVTGIAGFGTIPWMMGIIGDFFDLRTGFILIPSCFISLCLVTLVIWIKFEYITQIKK